MSLPYSLKKNPLTKAISIHFHCPHCNGGLVCPLKEAGQLQNCPDCKNPFEVPGAEALFKHQQEIGQIKADTEKDRQIKLEEIEQEHAARQEERHMMQILDQEIQDHRSKQARYLKTYGHACSIIGIITIAFFSFLYPTAIDTTGSMSPLSNIVGEKVVNIGLLNNRLVGIIVSSALLVNGAFLYGLGRVVEAVHALPYRMEEQ